MEVTELKDKFKKLHDDVTALVDEFINETGIEIYDVQSNVPHCSMGHVGTTPFVFMLKMY